MTSEPAGARIFISGALDATCEAPCNIRLAAGEYIVRLSLAGYQDADQTIQIADEIQALTVPLTLLRGNVIVETPAPATLKVNGTRVGTQSPAELSLALASIGSAPISDRPPASAFIDKARCSFTASVAPLAGEDSYLALPPIT